MSKFFRALSESESETESSDEEQIQPARTAYQRPMPAFVLSDSEDDQKRVVRPEKDRRFEELRDLIKQIRNLRKIKDMSKILTTFEDLCRVFQKAKAVIDREGGVTPRFFLRSLTELEDFVNENWDDRKDRKTLSKNNARGLATLRQKLRKYMRDFETELTDYRREPDSDGHSTEEEERKLASESARESSDEEREIESRKVRRSVNRESDESDWEMSSSSESELEDLTGKKMEELRRFFLKSSTKEDDDRAKKKMDRKKRREDKERPAEGKREDADGEWQQVTMGALATEEAPKMFEKDAEITAQAVSDKLREIISARRRKGADRFLTVEMVRELRKIAEAREMNPALLGNILFSLISSYFDCNPKSADCLLFKSWLGAMDALRDLIQLLLDNPDVLCSIEISDEQQNVTDPQLPWKLRGCVLSVLERLDDEFTKILQDADCHSTDYVEKLKGEKTICAIINLLVQYMESRDSTDEELCRAYTRKVGHLYYKFDPASVPMDVENFDSDKVNAPCSYKEMRTLCQFIYVHDTTHLLRTRAVLCQVYHLAIHDRWYEGRDILLMSHLQTHIERSDIPTQILFNRAVCQLGLCAFRQGLIREALNALSDLQNGGRAKELLAQGAVMRTQDRTVEQEKLERQRRVPYHMHINLELTECVYLLCAMLLEIPMMASKEFEVRRRMISRSFHYQLKQSERQYLIGPPENTREHVMAASKALLVGDWRACRDFLINKKMNSKVWNLFQNSERVKQMIIRHVKEESLKTYLVTYSCVYDSISLDRLGSMFELEPRTVHTIVSKMIIEGDFPASFDEPSACVVINHVEPKRLHTLALQITEKLNVLAENVEQLIDPRTTGNRGYSNYLAAQRGQNY
ncbi:eukaryotic translation initiation factor 3 [Trichuris trichiura]|uniref:Eukaryotic translation initiation factor 3 subunit C n=1 Tax=Trichuris trichiura TaxID=36087 RepID=A0A077ZMS6_TRITR|nr:eukaryotic translation initiation factor 3 [Trichuris trichiura]